MKIVPDAISMRSHAVVQSGPLLANIVKNTSIRVDSTLFLPEMVHIRAVDHLTPYGTLRRIPFFWADDYELMKPDSEWSVSRLLEAPGHKVFMFHPIHIYLNSHNSIAYAKAKKRFPQLDKATVEGLRDLIHEGDGVRTMFMELVVQLAKSGSRFLYEIVTP